jgi:DNA topoisomerase-1
MGCKRRVLSRKRRIKVALLPSDPYQSARIAGLRYVSDEMPGIKRRRAGSGFAYFDPDGRPVRDRDTLGRIRALVIPPAWTNVWICPIASGHLQAVGWDARGRKQYRYHPLYRRVRDATKFTRMIAFGLALPKLRARVNEDLKLTGLPRNKVLATIVALLEETCIRIGNEEYRKQNESFGLTTLRNRHVQIDGHTLRFHFKGKSGQIHDIELTDRKLARIVRMCQCIPGQELFQYVDDDGHPVRVTSDDVNAYLREITGEDFTAKDFRTWNGTREALIALNAMGPAESQTQAKKNIVEAVKTTAQRLNNRPAACRKYYIHPAVLESYADGSLFGCVNKLEPEEGPFGLSCAEVAMMKLVAAHKPTPVREATTGEKLPAALKQSLKRIASAAANIGSVDEIQVVPSNAAVSLA